jgi:hypothetical protein
MHQLIPHSKLHIYHGGHLGLLTHAPELTVLIQEFLSAEVNTHNSSLMSSLRLSWRYMMRQALPFFSAYSQ